MSGIALTASMRSNLMSLQQTQGLMDMTSTRLSTGRKVNSALDDPSAFFQSKGLTNRANDLSALLDGMGQAIQTLQAASKGIDALTSLVDQAKAVADEAFEAAAAASDNARITDTDVSKNLTDSLSSTATLTVVTDDGTKSFFLDTNDTVEDLIGKLNTVDGVSASLDSNNNLLIETTKSVSIENADGLLGTDEIDGAHSGSVFTLGIKLTDTVTLSGTSNSVSFGTTSVNLQATYTDGTDVFNALKAGLSSASFKVDVNSDNEITVEYVGTETTAVAVGSLGQEGNDIFKGGSSLITGTGGSMTLGGSVNNDDLVKQFNELRTQIDQQIKDTGYKGINLLNGSTLTVNFNEDRTSSMTISGVKFDAAGLGVTAASGWSTTSDIQTAIDNTRAAIDTLRSQDAKFGRNASVVQTREDFTKNMISTLTSGSDKLTLADMNEEGANMLALQTRQQLATSSLSMASQASQSVLSLFR